MLEQQCKYALELLNLLNKQKLTDRRAQLQVTFLNLYLVICPYSTYVQYCTVMYCTHVQKTVESQVTLFTFGQLSVQYSTVLYRCTEDSHKSPFWTYIWLNVITVHVYSTALYCTHVQKTVTSHPPRLTFGQLSVESGSFWQLNTRIKFGSAKKLTKVYFQ